MITEDYVSFETAKLLAENGIENDCEFTGWIGESGNHYFPDDTYLDDDEMIVAQKDRKEFIPLVSLQMAMKWLRKVHRIDIEVRTHYLNHLKPNDIRYYSGKILKGNEDVIHTIYSKDTYEEVCEAAIKYCLENLI